ncbi:uncharacterized protein LOC127709512 isoform X3 [Mytilus californianus]|uniref:uncharacterized protein LOC127709512 isoform X3 n=1 Tax=Mytilus californianus TaxID=6549 RepID=UPI002246E43A|nr:uncharacterized protein LOC127709512 isoform X3 [Mytilus californianus]
MRLNTQLIRSRAKGPLQTVEYLDLSNTGIETIEKLNSCAKLHTLNLRGNALYEVINLESCQQLWNIDLSNNELKSLDGLSKFVALGNLNLSNNDLTWHELGKIRHLHILNLSFHGNRQLEKDTYYRIHIVDCLPHVWMLDGRLITAGERLQVKNFFHESALTEHPIRHKLSKDWFIPTAMKRIDVTGIFGDKATHVMTKFPVNGMYNVETDRRRLKYIAYSLQEDLLIEKKYTQNDYQILRYHKSFMEDILSSRPRDRERCNMLLMLLVASLEFVMPTHLMKDTLETTKLSKVGNVFTMDIFLLSRDVRCYIVSILLGAVKVDKDDKEDGGLYDKLYLCLFYTISELTKLSHAVDKRECAIRSKLNTVYRDYKCLLASEVVQLLCIVPTFFDYITKDIGVMNLVITATGDKDVTEKINKVSVAVREEGGDVNKMYEELSALLLQKVQEQSKNISNKSPRLSSSDEILSPTKLSPVKSINPVDVADFHMRGVTSPEKDPPRVVSARKPAERFPKLGDSLLLGPQTLGKIVSLPQPFVALVAMDSVPAANGAMQSKLKSSEDHYTYVNMDQLLWDQNMHFWKPKGAIGDSILLEYLTNCRSSTRLTIHTVEDLQKELERKANMADRQLRPNSPDWQASHGTEPLIYSPRHPPPSSAPPRPKSNQGTPRPMSSLLKEKLDLKLDLSRRTESAAGYLEARQSSENIAKPSSPTSISGETDGPSECYHCALEAARTNEEKENIKSSPEDHHAHHHHDHKHEEKEEKKDKEKIGSEENLVHNSTENATNEQLSNKENKEPKTFKEKYDKSKNTQREIKTTYSARESTSAPTLQIQIPSSADIKEEVKSKEVKTPSKEVTYTRPSSIPPTEAMSPDGTHPQQSSRGKAAFMISGSKPVTGTRPFSAVDAYKYIVAHPIRQSTGSTENSFSTSYQQQRTDVWKQNVTARPNTTAPSTDVVLSIVATPAPSGRRKSPPPQRPSSPANRGIPPHHRPKSAVLQVRAGTEWLAGGRDLHWEKMSQRPRNSHVPGWKDGLPDNFQRPKSAVANRTYKRSRASTPVTPSSLAYDNMIHGWRSPQGSLPELTDLSDYYHPHQQHLLRMLGSSPQTGQSHFYNPPPQDTVYSTPPCSPRANSPIKILHLDCIIETEDTAFCSRAESPTLQDVPI